MPHATYKVEAFLISQLCLHLRIVHPDMRYRHGGQGFNRFECLHVAHLALMVLRVPLGLDIDRALYFIALRVLQVIGMQVVAPQGLVIAVTKSNGLGIT